MVIHCTKEFDVVDMKIRYLTIISIQYHEQDLDIIVHNI